jgi:pSer/pThr/pTyr-binding forkhead associated (FHA) protein
MAEWHVMLNDRILERFWIEEGDIINIGRERTARVRLDNAAVSRQHARLEMRDNIYLLTDMKSVNGTFVNGRKIKGTTPVTGADRIEIGKFRFVLGRNSEGSYPPFAMVRTPGPELASLPATPAEFERTVFVAPRRLTVIEGNATPQQLSLKEKAGVTFGKDGTCDVCIPGRRVGKIQCHILVRDHKHYLIHHSGWKRTTLNGRKVHGEERLHRGDTIGIGGTKLRFE